jgi:hypothetical protein
MEKILPIELSPQKTRLWCWAASAEMIMQYISKKTVSQCEQASKYFSLNSCCQAVTPENCINGGWPQFEQYGFLVQKTQNEPLSWTALTTEIENNRPFAFTWRYRTGGGHMMIVVGYREDGGQQLVHIMDPFPVGVGAVHPIPYEEFAKPSCGSHWNDFFSIIHNDAPGGPTNMSSSEDNSSLAASLSAAKNAIPYAITIAGLDVPGAGEPEIGQPLSVLEIGLDALKSDAPGGAVPNSSELESRRVINPLLVGGQLKGAITTALTEDGTWKPVSYGLTGVPKLAEKIRRTHSAQHGIALERYYVVEVRGLGLAFVGVRNHAGDDWIPIVDDNELNWKAEVALPMVRVLEELSRVAKRHNNLPG